MKCMKKGLNVKLYLFNNLLEFYNNPGEQNQSIMKINDEFNALVH